MGYALLSFSIGGNFEALGFLFFIDYLDSFVFRFQKNSFHFRIPTILALLRHDSVNIWSVSLFNILNH